MTYPISPLPGVNLDGIETKFFALGTEVWDNEGSRRMLVSAAAAITANDTIHIDHGFQANAITPALAIKSGQIGNATVSCSAASQYFWAKMNGNWTIRVAVSCKDDVPLYTTDTAGVLDDASVSLSQYQIMGLEVKTGNSNSAAGISSLPAVANNPLVRHPKAGGG